MTKEKIIAKMAKEAGITKKAAAESLNSFIGTVKTELKKGSIGAGCCEVQPGVRGV